MFYRRANIQEQEHEEEQEENIQREGQGHDN